jgi:hypothetical protein
MSRFLRSRRGLLPGAFCTWVSSVVLYPGWFFNSNFNYVTPPPSTILYVTALLSCHERPIFRQELSQVINQLVGISSLGTLLSKNNEMILIKEISYYHFNIILPSHTHAFQFGFSSQLFLSNIFLPVPHLHYAFYTSTQRTNLNLIALIIFTGCGADILNS